MEKQRYLQILNQRRFEAAIHHQQMVEKYFDELGTENNITSWDYRDYPKPYDSNYISVFLRLLFNSSITDIRVRLECDFIGDKVDREYLADLLVDIEELGLAKEGAVVVDLGIALECFDPPLPGQSKTINRSGSAIFHGGPSFERRASIVRAWCADRAAVEIAGNLTTTPDSDTDLDSTSKKGKTGHSAEREDISLDSELSAGMLTQHCDTVAQGVKLCPPGKKYIHYSGGNARIWALAAAIHAASCASAPVNRLAQFLGKRYGYIVGEKFTNKRNDHRYQNLFETAQITIEGMRKDRVF